MKFNRITPERVLAAYEATGLEPCRELGEDKYACPLQAVAKHERNRGISLSEKCGVTRNYAFGFFTEWDGVEYTPDLVGIDPSSADFKLGMEDAKKVELALKAKMQIIGKKGDFKIEETN